jgi:hypothetical protein
MAFGSLQQCEIDFRACLGVLGELCFKARLTARASGVEPLWFDLSL